MTIQTKVRDLLDDTRKWQKINEVLLSHNKKRRQGKPFESGLRHYLETGDSTRIRSGYVSLVDGITPEGVLKIREQLLPIASLLPN